MANERKKRMMGGPAATNCFSLIIGEDYETVDFVAPSVQSFNAWVFGLKVRI